jgi:hypothetical protein
MRIPLEPHLTLYGTKVCIVNRLPLEDLSINVGHSGKTAKVMIHGDEGIGVDGLKELVPGPSTHDGIHIGDIMEQAWSHIHYELVTLLPVMHVQPHQFCFPARTSGLSSCQSEDNQWQCLQPYLLFLPII